MATSFIEPGIFNNPRPKKSVLPPPNKRRRIDHKVEEISFDDSKREDYLTGFHKRKLQRIKRAQEENEKKAKEERRQMRKQLREERKEELEEHVEAVNKALREVGGSSSKGLEDEDDVWGGIEEDEEDKIVLPSVDHEEEYVDEDRYTTVTVEAVDVTKDGLHRVADGEDEVVETKTKKHEPNEDETKLKKKWPKKEKPKKFRYESKLERRITRGKQKHGNRAKADARRDR